MTAKFPTLFALQFKGFASKDPDSARAKIVELMRVFQDLLLTDAPKKAADLRSALAMFEESAANRKYKITFPQMVELLEMYGAMIYGMFDKHDSYLVSKFNDAFTIVSAPVAPTGALPVAAAAPAAPATAAAPQSLHAVFLEEKTKRTPVGFARLLSDFNQQVKLQVVLDRSTKKDQSFLLQQMDLLLQAYLRVPSDALVAQYIDLLGKLSIADYYTYIGILSDLLTGRTLPISSNKAKSSYVHSIYSGGRTRCKKRRNKRRKTQRKAH